MARLGSCSTVLPLNHKRARWTSNAGHYIQRKIRRAVVLIIREPRGLVFSLVVCIDVEELVN